MHAAGRTKPWTSPSTIVPAGTPVVGQTLSHYEVLDKLGEGGMGAVYRARDTRLGRVVAIKMLRPEVADDDRKRRFFHEARAASSLNHPNIITVYDIDAESGADFIVMEHVPGRSLDRVIAGRPLPLGEALRYAVQIADALAAAHDAGIIHRDLKPGNVLVSDEGRVKVLDFGLAKLTDPQWADPAAATESWRYSEPQTEQGTILGTVAYMSPEQAEGRAVDARSDIFSFGAVFYEMLTGRRPFDGESRISTLAAIVHSEPPAVTELAPFVPREVERVVHRCLRKQPDRRVQTAADLKLALEDLKEESDSGRLTGIPAPPPVRRRSLFRPLFAVGFTLCLAAVAIGSSFYWMRHNSRVPRAVPLTSAPGVEDYAAFSPDGNQIAYSWNGEKQDNYDIYVQVAPGDQPLRLTSNPEPELRPAWSPDGRQIAFQRGLDSPDTWVIGALGGPERKIVDGFRPGGWTPDGTELIVFDGRTIWAAPVMSGRRRQITWPPAGFADSEPALSPDGKHLAFVRTHGLSTSVSDIYRIDFRTAGPQSVPARITHVRARIHGLTWTRDSREIIFSSVHTGAASLWRVPASGGGLRPLEGAGPDAVRPAMSPEGGRLAYTTRVLDTNIWRVATDTDGRRITAFHEISARPITRSNRQDRFPQFSPDGRKLIFISERSGMDQIWVSDPDGGDAVQLTSFAGASPSYWPRWSPDGRQIAFVARPGENVDVYIVNAAGGDLHPFANLPGNELWPDWSRDGKWIFYSTFRDGKEQIWKAPLSGGPHVMVTTGGDVCIPRVSPDGRYVYFVRRGTENLWRVPVDGGREERVLDNCGWDYALYGTGVLYFDTKRRTLSFYDFEANREVATCSRLPVSRRSGIAVAPDGRSAALTREDRLEGDIVVIENFR